MSSKLSIIIPCHNEEEGIAQVITAVPTERLRHLGFETEIIIVDNNCTDKTAEICKSFDVRLICEYKKGKGNAMRAGFNAVSKNADFVVMLDGDNTYKPNEIPRLLEPLATGFCDVIVGSRLGGKVNKGAFSFQNRLVNWGFAFLVRQFYRANITDVLSGYFAWNKKAIDGLKQHLNSDGFGIEMEMITKTVKLGFEIYSVPITYDKREGQSKIKAFRDGVIILRTLFSHIFWQPLNNWERGDEQTT